MMRVIYIIFIIFMILISIIGCMVGEYKYAIVLIVVFLSEKFVNRDIDKKDKN